MGGHRVSPWPAAGDLVAALGTDEEAARPAGTALLTTDEAAPLLRICERSVRQGLNEGRITHVRVGRRLLNPRAETAGNAA